MLTCIALAGSIFVVSGNDAVALPQVAAATLYRGMIYDEMTLDLVGGHSKIFQLEKNEYPGSVMEVLSRCAAEAE